MWPSHKKYVECIFFGGILMNLWFSRIMLIQINHCLKKY